MVKAILAVVVGFAVWSLVWLSFNALLRWLGILLQSDTSPARSMGPLALLLVASFLFSLAAGYLAASIIDSSSYFPAVVLAALLVLTGAFVQSRLWRLMPLWYHVPFLLLLAPMTLAGAWLWLG